MLPDEGRHIHMPRCYRARRASPARAKDFIVGFARVGRACRVCPYYCCAIAAALRHRGRSIGGGAR